MSFSRSFRGYLFVGLLLTLCASWAQADELSDLISQAQTSLQQGQAQQAYDALVAQEPTYAGDVNFDYWLGLTAVRAGQPARAVFALERVLAQQPNHAGARLEMATAYMQLGQRDEAAEQLDKLETLNPPPKAQERIAAINAELNRQARNDRERRNGGYVGLELGSDDNVGSWPQGLEFFPGATITAIDSLYGTVSGGYWHRFDVAADQKIMVNANGLVRRNDDSDAKQFDQDYLTASAEWSRDLDGRNEIAASAQAAGLNLDGDSYYKMFGVGTAWSRQTDEKRRWTLGLRLQQLDFDLDQYSYQLSRLYGHLDRRLNSKWDLTADLNVDYEAADVDRPGGDASVYSLTSMLWYQVTLKQRVGGSLGIAHADYHTRYELGQAITPQTGMRRDERYSAALLYDWYPGSRWQVRGQVRFRKQQSTLDAFTYDQTVGSLGLNYYF